MTSEKARLQNKLDTIETERKAINEKLEHTQHMSSGQRHAYKVLRHFKIKQIENLKRKIKAL